MEIRKAVITAAGPGQRALLLQTLVDRDRKTKTALAIIIEEALNCGADEICVVVHPGDADNYRASAGPHGQRLQFVEQTETRGYGHAVWCARGFTGSDPFLLLVGDHLYLSRENRSCARQLVEAAASESCAVSAVQATHESKLPYYGVAGGRLADHRKGLYLVSEVMEKPTPTIAEQQLVVPGLRVGHYLCFFGMHVLTPAVMDLLGTEVAAGGRMQAQHGAGAAGASRTLPGFRTAGPPVRHRVAIRAFERPVRFRPQQPGPGGNSIGAGGIAGSGNEIRAQNTPQTRHVEFQPTH